VDICYPPENYGEYRRILRYGCVLSEYSPGTRPLPYNFPRRNRIITGLSLGIIVVEAAEKSGTSRTVEIALAQGREVFVVPGSVLSLCSVGTNNLIKDGAVPVTTYLDVLYALRRELGSAFYGMAGLANESGEGEHTIKRELCAEERLLMKHLSETPADVGFLAALTGLSAQDVMFFLSKMEIAGIVKSVPAGYLKE
jgi:DNA processing protein